jgi:hypothetical protein
MRRLLLPLFLSLFLIQSAPVTPAPFGFPVQPPGPVVLNGCTENALFAILNSQAGQACLQYLPRASNVATRFSLFCRAGRWGCCDKQTGYPNCKIEEAIPYQRTQRPPLAVQP